MEENPALEEGEDTGDEEPTEEEAIAEIDAEAAKEGEDDFDLSDYLQDDDTPDYRLSVKNKGADDEDRETPLAGGATFQEVLIEGPARAARDRRAPRTAGPA